MAKKCDLVRAVGRWDLTALAINGLIGSAIFGLPATVAHLTGAWSPYACVVCGGIVLLVVLCFAEASSLFWGTGGPYLYAREAFGDPVGFAGGWMMWLARVTAFAANINLFVSFLGFFIPGIKAELPRAAVMVAVVGLLGAINIRGVRQGALVGDILAAAKMIPLAAFVLVGLFAINPILLSVGPWPGRADFGQAVLLYVFAFTGFEYAAIPAGEALAPKRHLPLAMLTAIIAACLLYAGIQVVCLGTLRNLAQSQTAMADAAVGFLGGIGGGLMALTALASISGNLSGMALISPRLTYVLAKDGFLPSGLCRLHSCYRTPYVSILLFAVLTLGLALSGTFVGMVRISSVARIIPYALTCLAVPALRKRHPDEPDRFRLKGGALIPILAVMLCIWLLAQSPIRDLSAATAAMGAGYLIYGCTAVWNRSLGRKA